VARHELNDDADVLAGMGDAKLAEFAIGTGPDASSRPPICGRTRRWPRPTGYASPI
jgi:hypothetical protein